MTKHVHGIESLPRLPVHHRYLNGLAQGGSFAAALQDKRAGSHGTVVVPWVVRQTKYTRQERRCRGYTKSAVR